MLKNIIGLISGIVLLSGCVAGQNIKMDYTPHQNNSADSGIVVRTVVSDERDYIRNGNKDPWYIGHYRAGFGNTWDVSTFQKVPLAEQITRDLKEDLANLGHIDDSNLQPEFELQVKINEWNFDAYQNGRFWYDLQVITLNYSGQKLQEFRVKGEEIIKGSFFGGAKSGFERKMPIIYNNIITSITRNEKHPLN